MLPSFRLYYKDGCSHCHQVDLFLRENNIPVERIEVGTDPVLTAGIENLVGHNVVPVLVSFITSEVLNGYNLRELERVIQIYRFSLGTMPTDNVGFGSKNIGETKEPVR